VALTRLSSTRDFFRVWFYWKYHASFIFILIVLTVAVFMFMATPIYESRAKILILPRTTEGVIITVDAKLDQIDLITTQDINTEIELITSENVARDTVKAMMEKGQGLGLNPQKESGSTNIVGYLKTTLNNILVSAGIKKPLSESEANIRMLKNALKVEPVAMSDIIIVKLKNKNPQVAAAVLGKLLKTYIRHHNQVFSKDEGIDFYSDQATEYQNKLAQAEKKLNEFQSKWHIVDLQAQNVASIDQISDLNNELKHIEILIDETETKIELLKRGLKNDVEITKEMRTIPSIIGLEKALVPLYIERSSIMRKFTKSSREYQDVDAQINLILEQIRNEIEKAVRTEELELNVLKAKQNSLSQKITLTQKEADNLIQKERYLNDLQRQVELLQENYMLYASKTEDARIYSERNKRNLASVSIAETASIPTKPSAPKKRLMVLVSLFIGIFGALGIPFILEFLDHRIKTSDEVQTFLSLPVICTLPEVKDSALRKGEMSNG